VPFAKKFTILLAGTAYINAEFLNVALYATEPTNRYTRTYGTKATVTAAVDDYITWNAHGLAENAPVMFSSTGTLPTPLQPDVPYFLRALSGVNKFKLSVNFSDANIINITDVGTGTLTCHSGHAAGSATMNVLDDVSADPQWVSGAVVSLENSHYGFFVDQQRTTFTSATGTTVTIGAVADSLQYPFAKIWLLVRNVAIQCSGTGNVAAVTLVGGSTHGAVLNCEVRNTASTGATFYGTAVNFGQGHTIGGVLSGFNQVLYQTRNVNVTANAKLGPAFAGLLRNMYSRMQGTISGVSTGLGTDHRTTVSGTIEGSSIGFDFCTDSILSGSCRGGLYCCQYSRNIIVTGRVVGTGTGFYGTGFIMEPQAAFYPSYPSSGAVSLFLYVGDNAASTAMPESLVRGLPGGLDTYFVLSQRNSHGGQYKQRVSWENYLGTADAQRTFWVYGDTIKNTSVVRTGGAANSIEVVPQSKAGFNNTDTEYKIPIFEWTELDVPASAQTRTVYIKGTSWSSYPADTQLWFEVEYLDHATLFTRTVKHTYDAGIDTVLTDENWTAFTLTFTPGQVGPVRYRAFLADYEDGTERIYVDNMLVVG
jgi:hypothetical protein